MAAGDEYLEESWRRMPPLSREFIQALERRYPLRLPHLKMEDREIWYGVGQRSVVDFLMKVYERQTEQMLENR